MNWIRYTATNSVASGSKSAIGIWFPFVAPEHHLRTSPGSYTVYGRPGRQRARNIIMWKTSKNIPVGNIHGSEWYDLQTCDLFFNRMNLVFDDAPIVTRIVTMRLDMSTARYQGVYNVHHFIGTCGFSEKIIRRQNNCVFMFEYANSTNVGGEIYSNIRFDAPCQTNLDEDWIKGKVWGISKFRSVSLGDVGHTLDANIVQTFEREQTWYFPTPVRIKKSKSERGRWMSMKDHPSEKALLVRQTFLATDGRAILSFNGTVEQLADIPGMFMYSKDPGDYVEYLGTLPGI